MEKSINSFTIIVPVYNEENNVRVLKDKIVEDLGSKYDVEIIFVNDGSTDNTLEELVKLETEDPSVKVVKFKKNFGKSAAYSAGIKFSSKEVIVTMDGDLQDDPSEIPNLLAELDKGADYVTGWKFEGKGNPYRAWPSKFFNFIVKKVTKLKLNDFNCPLKAFKKGVIEPEEIYGELYRFLPVLAHVKGYKIAETPVKNYPRLSGKSKYGLERFMRGFFDLLTINFITRYLRRPLHLIGGIGLLFSSLGVTTISVLYLLKFIFGFLIQNTPFLFALGILLVLVGLQFISLGLLSELLIKLFSTRNNKVYYLDK